MNDRVALVVDDDDDFRFQQKAALERLGFTVVTAESRADAMEKLEAVNPSLALVDLMMEEKDAGFVLAYQIKQRHPATPVILVTAVTGETGLEFDLQTSGDKRWIKADAILAKPIRFEQLQAEVERLVK